MNGVLQIQVCYKNAARVWPKGVWFHVFDSNLRHIQYSTRLAFPCLWHYAPRSEGGCLRPTSKGGLRLTDSVNPLGSYWFLQRQEIKVNTQDSRPHLHQAIYLHFRSFERGGVSELSYAQSEDRPPSQATVTVFKKHLVSKVPHWEKDREGSTVGQV